MALRLGKCAKCAHDSSRSLVVAHVRFVQHRARRLDDALQALQATVWAPRDASAGRRGLGNPSPRGEGGLLDHALLILRFAGQSFEFPLPERGGHAGNKRGDGHRGEAELERVI